MNINTSELQYNIKNIIKTQEEIIKLLIDILSSDSSDKINELYSGYLKYQSINEISKNLDDYCLENNTKKIILKNKLFEEIFTKINIEPRFLFPSKNYSGSILDKAHEYLILLTYI